MIDETKQLFDAPWHVEQHNRYFGPQIHAEVRDSRGALIADVDPYNASFVKANRIAHLPELYDALNKQAYYRCVDCLRHTAKTMFKQEITQLFINEMIKK